MYKKSKLFIIAISVIAMMVIGVLFGFTTLQIPRMAYVFSWFACLALVEYSSRNMQLER